MFLTPYLLTLLASLPTAPPMGGTAERDRLTIEHEAEGMTLDWMDVEDRLKGTLRPLHLRANETATISVAIGPFDGPEYTGPVTMSLRPQQGGGGETVTVALKPGEKAWTHVFVPQEEGTHVVEIAFLSTRRKVVRGTVQVDMARMPTWLPPVFGVFALLAGIFITLSMLNRKSDAPPAVVSDSPPSPVDTAPPTEPPSNTTDKAAEDSP